MKISEPVRGFLGHCRLNKRKMHLGTPELLHKQLVSMKNASLHLLPVWSWAAVTLFTTESNAYTQLYIFGLQALEVINNNLVSV